MTELRMAVHSMRGKAAAVVEIWEDGLFIGAIYPADRGVRIVSKHLDAGLVGSNFEHLFPPTFNLRIWNGEKQEMK